MRALRLLVPTVLVTLVACAELFDEPAQCKSDRDCERFDGVCDLASAVCVVGGSAEDGGADAPFSPSESGAGANATTTDAPLPERCNISPKPAGTVGTKLDAGRAEITGAVTLGCDKDWSLDSLVFVRSGATLTIEAGTTLRAKKGVGAGIVVSAGGRIVAAGTRDAPVVITSEAPSPAAGDWRGIYVLGLAPPAGQGAYEGDPDLAWGGANADDDSGVLSFVRIEYARNGLTFAGAGKKTKVDYVQVRRTIANCFMFNGGTVDAKHLVCQSPGDDQFEWYLGYEGRAQFLFGQDTAAAPIFGAHGMLVDDARPIIYNATFCGRAPAPNGYGVLFRDNATLALNNAIASGWFAGVDATGTVAAGTIRGSVFFGNATNPAYAEDPAEPNADLPQFNDDNGFDELAMINTPGAGNAVTDPKLTGCLDAKAPKPWPQASLTTNAQTPPADGFFDGTATYIGAFKDDADPWMTGAWVRFDDK